MKKITILAGLLAVLATGLMANKCGDVSLGEPKDEAPIGDSDKTGDTGAGDKTEEPTGNVGPQTDVPDSPVPESTPNPTPDTLTPEPTVPETPEPVTPEPTVPETPEPVTPTETPVR